MADAADMNGAEERNALRRKATARPRVREADAMSPARAMRLALARAAGDLWELPLTIAHMRHELVAQEDLLERFASDHMMILLDGPAGICGGLHLDRALLGAVTEVQTLGEVTKRDSPARPFTPTDGAMIAPLVDEMLQRLDVMLATGDRSTENSWVIGYRFGALLDTPRALALALEGESFHYLACDVDIAAGMRQGKVVLCLPVGQRAEQSSQAPDQANGDGRFSEAMAQVNAKLIATLPALNLSLAQARSLKVGDTLPLSSRALTDAALRSVSGEVVARGVVGKSDGQRALCLAGAPAHSAAGQEVDGEWFEQAASSPEASSAAQFTPTKDAHVKSVQTPEQEAPGDLNAALEPVTSAVEDLPDLPPMTFDDTATPQTSAPSDATGNVNFE